MGDAAVEGTLVGKRPPSNFWILAGQVQRMIILFHPRSTKPKNRRLPLSVLYLGAVLEGREEYEIVDGNADPDPWTTIDALMQRHPVELLGVSVMPGPQLPQAIAVCRAVPAKNTRVFPSPGAATSLPSIPRPRSMPGMSISW